MLEFEQMAGIARLKGLVALGVEGDLGEDGDAEADFRVGLADVGIDRAENDARLDSRLLEGPHDAPAPREAGIVGDDRIFGDFLDRQPLHIEDRMVASCHDAAWQLEARQLDEVGVLAERLGADGKVGLAAFDHVADRLRVALLEDELDQRVALDEGFDDLRKNVARLRVGGPDGEGAALARPDVFLQGPQRLHVGHDAPRDVQHMLAGLRDAHQAVAGSGEDLEAKLRLQKLDLAAHAGLRGVEGFGRGGEVVSLPHDFQNVAELLQFHDGVRVRSLCQHLIVA